MFSRFLEAGYTVYYWRVMVHLIKLATAMHEAVEGHIFDSSKSALYILKAVFPFLNILKKVRN